MTYRFNIRAIIGLTLSLLLFAIAVAPACILMMPAPAMASQQSFSGACDMGGGGSTTGAACPHTSKPTIIQAKEDRPDLPALPPVAVSVEPATVAHVAYVASVVADERPIAHLTPLRL